MDPAFLNNIVDSIRTVLLRSAGSKRLFSFFVWLLAVLYMKPDGETLRWTVLVLLTLWWLFIRFPANDQNKEHKP